MLCWLGMRMEKKYNRALLMVNVCQFQKYVVQYDIHMKGTTCERKKERAKRLRMILMNFEPFQSLDD